MLKKIIVWTVFVGLVGIMVFGAVNRTAAKTENGTKKLSDTVESISPLLAIDGSGKNGQSGNNGQGKNSRSVNTEGNRQSRTYAGNDLAVGSGENLHENSPEDHEWVIISGYIAGLDSSNLWIQTENADSVEVAGRAWRYAAESGYLPEVGNGLELLGFYENSEYKVSEIRDLTSGEVVLLRDDSGHPLWSGGAKGN